MLHLFRHSVRRIARSATEKLRGNDTVVALAGVTRRFRVHIRKLVAGLKNGQKKAFLDREGSRGTLSPLHPKEMPYVESVPTPAHKILSRLVAIEENLDDFERRVLDLQHQLPKRDREKLPVYSQQSLALIQELETLVHQTRDIPDLSHAVSLLRQAIKNYKRTLDKIAETPQPIFSKYHWQWDPAWKELYTYLPAEDCYLYLSRWTYTNFHGWRYCMVSHRVGLTPEKAAELLECWGDWKWDPTWREWYLPLQEEEGDFLLYASRWRKDKLGIWRFLNQKVVPEAI